MADSEEKKLHSDHAADDIRADELVKLTQPEVKENTDHLRDIPVTNSNYWRFRGENHRQPLPRGIKWAAAGLIVLFVGGFAVSYYIVKREIAATISSRIGTLQAGVQDLQNLDPPIRGTGIFIIERLVVGGALGITRLFVRRKQRHHPVIHRSFQSADNSFKQYDEH